MAVTKFTQEIKVKVSSKRLFKAFATDPYTVLPKILPNFIKSVEIIHGDGGAGTIRQTNFADGAPHSYMKHKIEHLDAENHVAKYSLIEGAVLGDKIEKISYDQKYEDTSDGGCVIKIVGEYHTKGNFQVTEEDIKAGKDEALQTVKHVEEILLAHPDICA
ncbi:hypothetical protein CDL12_29409 [Handroanthus impetiginosus]|uniref:Bet v I/Major latex protein domain-containing protein n=1 Tax=Handroanthus impetiginosus TaxID=429701 RepID=A0A2G9FYI1_9LAMI|nr:hypothetical protein CDL12_29409 [Handroanthus impetiginosus]